MTFPTQNFYQIYAFVANGVVYDISSSQKKDDPCCIEVTKAMAPQFSVNSTPYYLINMIEDGDSYEGGTFKKRIHGATETTSAYTAYFLELCKEELKNSILKYHDMGYEEFMKEEKTWGIPSYMVVQSNIPVQGIDQIDLTEAEYNKIMEEGVAERALQQAEKTANYYGYHVTTEKLTVAKKEG